MPDHLEFDAVSKEFPGVRALDAVSLSVPEKSVRALIGENGAGKSTLLKILSGAYQPTAGRVLLDGKPCVFRTTADALAQGVAVIYQELNLVPEMTVAENIFLGHMPKNGILVDRKTLNWRARELLGYLGEDINPGTKLSRLPIGQRQMVEIAKALSRGAKVIAFDEPTSSLSAREIGKLFTVIRELRVKGCVILYVSHRMEEIFSVCDSVTVLRDGRHVETFRTLNGVTHDVLVNRMVGRDIKDVFAYQPRPHGDTALEVDALLGPGITAPVSLRVARGEILGMYGLVGAGRSELLKLIYGAQRATSGHVRIHGCDARIRSPAAAIRAGVVLCPEDRKKEGIFPVRSVAENLNLSARRRTVRLGGVLNRAWEHRNAEEKVKRLDVKTPSLEQLLVNLSGGNQQKVILGRWLSEDVKVILLDEPTRGIDVGAKSEIYMIVQELARSGVGVVLVSSDLPEVLGIADRVVVMREGRIAGELSRAEASEQAAMRLALPESGRAG